MDLLNLIFEAQALTHTSFSLAQDLFLGHLGQLVGVWYR